MNPNLAWERKRRQWAREDAQQAAGAPNAKGGEMRVGQARKRDWNEAEIRAALHQIGVVTVPLSAAGVPDLLCYSTREGFRLLEVKTPRGKLTPAQVKFRAVVPFDLVRSVDEALALYGVMMPC